MKHQFLVRAALGVLVHAVCVDAPLASVLDDAGIEVHGFIDVRAGQRTEADDVQKDASLAEERLQLDIQRTGDLTTLQLRADLLYDDVPEDRDQDLEEGTGYLDLREANIQLSPLDMMDVKLGRQILTWGTGDMLFINDMFPKDWQSFFSGRDVEYLKAPSDALFVSLFPEFASIDIVYTPRFDADRFISGSRISYWNSMAGGRAGREAVVDPQDRDEWFDDDELAVRISRDAAGLELCLYGYDGFWKSPMGLDPAAMRPIFPRLTVYGFSVRGSVGQGVANLEGGYYRSSDDSDGDDPFVPNDEIRGLLGYERELARNTSGSVQYYVENMQEYDAYRDALAEGQPAREEHRQVVTLRLTRQAFSQNLVLSLFAYYSPTDKDAYIRTTCKYKVTDDWLVFVGGNQFLGQDDHTFFGQFEDNSNVYGGARYSF